MAALNIAFEVPARDWHVSPSRSRPLDLVHLAVQTMGDKDLEAEVLQVFSRQARLALQEMGSADKAGMVAIAHRLKGAASAVGAFAVADAAMRVEAREGDAGLVAKLAAAVVDAENFILKLCR